MTYRIPIGVVIDIDGIIVGQDWVGNVCLVIVHECILAYICGCS